MTSKVAVVSILLLCALDLAARPAGAQTATDPGVRGGPAGAGGPLPGSRSFLLST